MKQSQCKMTEWEGGLAETGILLAAMTDVTKFMYCEATMRANEILCSEQSSSFWSVFLTLLSGCILCSVDTSRERKETSQSDVPSFPYCFDEVSSMNRTRLLNWKLTLSLHNPLWGTFKYNRLERSNRPDFIERHVREEKYQQQEFHMKKKLWYCSAPASSLCLKIWTVKKELLSHLSLIFTQLAQYRFSWCTPLQIIFFSMASTANDWANKTHRQRTIL